jgi:hypothetical protein
MIRVFPIPVHPTLPGLSSRSTVYRPPLLAVLTLICSPQLNCLSQALFLPSTLFDLLALLYQWTSSAGTFLGILTRQHRLLSCFFSLCLSLSRCTSRGSYPSKDQEQSFASTINGHESNGDRCTEPPKCGEKRAKKSDPRVRFLVKECAPLAAWLPNRYNRANGWTCR